MKPFKLTIIDRYILKQLAALLFMTLGIFTALFLIFEFFDRIDNIIAERPRAGVVVHYFLLKIPQAIALMTPIAVLVSTLMTIGLLSRNGELTAIRAAGTPITRIAAPILGSGFILSFFCLGLSELVVPHSSRRVKEIYNIDIKRKDESGAYSQNDFWWRSGNSFYSVGMFDSRSSTLSGFSAFDVTETMQPRRRVNAETVTYLDNLLGWSMQSVTDYRFSEDLSSPTTSRYTSFPFPSPKKPSDFYYSETDPTTMSFKALQHFIGEQRANGLSVNSYYADLYAKFSFPFICLVMPIVVLPFSLKPARSGSMATSIVAALCIGFSYYVVHSFAIALGRAEIIPPIVAAWVANVLMGTIGTILLIGSEQPH